MNERSRLRLLATGLVGCVAALSLAVVGGGATSNATNSGASPIHKAPVVPVAAMQSSVPANFWTDYVQVDAVDGTTLRVHSTRHPDETPPYTIVTDEHTILDPAGGLFAPSPGIGPGTRLYYTGTIESGTAPAPTSVLALRLFLFEDAPSSTP